MSELSDHQLTSLTHIILIDAPWRKAAGMIQDPSYRHVLHIKLSTNRGHALTSNFWRISRLPRGCLSTVEALYWFMVQLETSKNWLSDRRVLSSETLHDTIPCSESCSKEESKFGDLLYYFSFWKTFIGNRMLDTLSFSSLTIGDECK